MSKEWENEPNEVSFEVNRRPCLILREKYLGHLCGYCRVSGGLLERGYDHDSYKDIDVLGGLTYAGKIGDGWWIGFDCAHPGDIRPYSDNWFNNGYAVYRNIGYVKREVESLAKQLDQIEPYINLRKEQPND